MALHVDLPEGWAVAETPEGRIYFLNEIDRITTWDDPRVENSRRTQFDSIGGFSSGQTINDPPMFLRAAYRIMDYQKKDGFSSIDSAKLKAMLGNAKTNTLIKKPDFTKIVSNVARGSGNVVDRIFFLLDPYFENEVDTQEAYVALIFLSTIPIKEKLELCFNLFSPGQGMDQNQLYVMFKTLWLLIENPYHRYSIFSDEDSIIFQVKEVFKASELQEGQVDDGRISLNQFILYAVGDPLIFRPFTMAEKITKSEGYSHGKKCSQCSVDIVGIRYQSQVTKSRNTCFECFFQGMERDAVIEIPGNASKLSELPSTKRSNKSLDGTLMRKREERIKKAEETQKKIAEKSFTMDSKPKKSKKDQILEQRKKRNQDN